MPFIALESRQNLSPGYRKVHQVGRRRLLLLWANDEPKLLEDRCPHGDSPLVRGTVRDNTLCCPKHGIAFDLATGMALGGDAVEDIAPLQFVPLVWQGDTLGVEFDQ